MKITRNIYSFIEGNIDFFDRQLGEAKEMAAKEAYSDLEVKFLGDGHGSVEVVLAGKREETPEEEREREIRTAKYEAQQVQIYIKHLEGRGFKVSNPEI